MEEKNQISGNKPIWGAYALKADKPIRLNIGDAVIWCALAYDEIRICHSHDPELAHAGVEDLPDTMEWMRWAFKQKNPGLTITPIFPDRPLVVQPEASFRVAEDAKVRIYIRVPVWVRISLSGSTKTILHEIPSVVLSNSWFGDFVEGDLCYWLSSGARRTIEPDPARNYMAICPLILLDRSPEDLNVEKICLRASNLSIYEADGQLWSDETTITYKGKTEVSQVDVSGKAPKEAASAKCISEPRVKSKKSFSARTFASFKDLSTFSALSK